MTTKAVKPSMRTQRRLMKAAIRQFDASQTRLAEAVGCTQTMIWKLLHGKARISVEMARKIHRATDGRCPEHEFRPDFFEPPERAA